MGGPVNTLCWAFEHGSKMISPGHSSRNLMDDVEALRDALVERCQAPKTALLGGSDDMPEIHLYFASCTEATAARDSAESLVGKYRGEFCRVAGYFSDDS